MSGLFWNTVVSAVSGVVASIGTVWYLSANSEAGALAGSENSVAKVKRLEADSLVVADSLTLVDPNSRETLVEIRNGEIFVQRGVYANHIGAWRFTSQKFQTTPDDPLVPDCPVFGEFAVDESGGGYLELLSPQESHAVTIGFDQNERGALVSKNNEADVSATQALFLKPARDGRSERVDVASVRSDVAGGSFLR